MNYSLIRPLIYRERKSLEEFNVLDEHKDIMVNAFLYDRLLKIDYLHPKHDYATEETLRIFNDVHFFMTCFFLDETPLAHYADYRKIPNPNQQKDKLSHYRTVVELSMIYVILQCWHKTDWFRQKIYHDKFFVVLNGEIEKIVSNNHITDDTNIAKTLTSKSFYYRFLMSIHRDFAPRDIQEVVDGKESLKDCLAVGEDISKAVNLLCKDNTQKLGLIARLLEPEEKGYGAFSDPIPDAYRSLHELRSELTGQPLPAKLPFEKFKFPAPPMMGTPPELLEPVEKDDETEKMQARINELEELFSEQSSEIKRLREENAELRKKNEGDDEDCSDLDDIQRMGIDERIIFFSSAMGVSLAPELISQKRLAVLISKLSGDSVESIRTRIVALNTEEKKVRDNKLDGYSESTREAATHVYEYLEAVAKTETCKTKLMKDIMKNIDLVYQLCKEKGE